MVRRRAGACPPRRAGRLAAGGAGRAARIRHARCGAGARLSRLPGRPARRHRAPGPEDRRGEQRPDVPGRGCAVRHDALDAADAGGRGQVRGAVLRAGRGLPGRARLALVERLVHAGLRQRDARRAERRAAHLGRRARGRLLAGRRGALARLLRGDAAPGGPADRGHGHGARGHRPRQRAARRRAEAAARGEPQVGRSARRRPRARRPRGADAGRQQPRPADLRRERPARRVLGPRRRAARPAGRDLRHLERDDDRRRGGRCRGPRRGPSAPTRS